jgi:hypothetical protein
MAVGAQRPDRFPGCEQGPVGEPRLERARQVGRDASRAHQVLE